MNCPPGKRSRPLVTIVTSTLAGLIWLGVLTFLAKWFKFLIEGRLEPGQGTTWMPLIVLFSLAMLASAGGIYSSARAWRGKSRLRWQLVSLVGAILALLAVSGH